VRLPMTSVKRGLDAMFGSEGAGVHGIFRKKKHRNSMWDLAPLPWLPIFAAKNAADAVL
jgi:hypothetical protein